MWHWSFWEIKPVTSSPVCGVMWIHSPEKSAVAHRLHFTFRKWPADCQSFFCVTTWHGSAGGPSQSNRCMSVCSFVAVTRWFVSVMSWGAACKSSLIDVSELQLKLLRSSVSFTAKAADEGQKATPLFSFLYSSKLSVSFYSFYIHSWIHLGDSQRHRFFTWKDARPVTQVSLWLFSSVMQIKESLELRQFSFFVCMNSELHLLFTSFTQTGKHTGLCKIITPVFYSEKTIRWVFSGLIYNDGLHSLACVDGGCRDHREDLIWSFVILFIQTFSSQCNYSSCFRY